MRGPLREWRSAPPHHVGLTAMRPPHALMKLLLVNALSLSACTPAEDVSPGPSAQESVPAAGQVVAEIDRRILCIHQDRRGDHWFGSNGNGVYRYDGQRVIHYSRADGLGGDQVRDLAEDNEGNVFISTNDAVTKFDGTDFETLELVEAPADGSAWTLDPDDVWLVFNPGRYGPCRYDGNHLYHLPLSRSPVEDERSRPPRRQFTPAGVYSIYRDRGGHLWFGTAGVGVCRYDGQGLSWLYEERLTSTPGGGDFGIRCVYEDRSGHHWICNTRQRFEIRSEATFQDGHHMVEYATKEGLPDAQTDSARNFEYFSSMTEDHDGTIWMACGDTGVWRYDGDAVTKYLVGDGAYTTAIYCDRDGRLWVGTLEHGLFTFEGEGFEPFTPGESRKEH